MGVLELSTVSLAVLSSVVHPDVIRSDPAAKAVFDPLRSAARVDVQKTATTLDATRLASTPSAATAP